MAAYAIVEVAALGVFESEENIGVRVNHLEETHDVGMLQLLHCLHLSFDLLLHALFADFVLVQNFEAHESICDFVDGHYATGKTE